MVLYYITSKKIKQLPAQYGEDPSINDQYQRRPEKSRRHAQKVKIDMSYSYYLTN